MAWDALAAARQQTPDPDSVTPGVLGFLAVFVLAVATWFLVRSMNRHLRRVRFSEEAEREALGARGDGLPPGGGPAGGLGPRSPGSAAGEARTHGDGQEEQP